MPSVRIPSTMDCVSSSLTAITAHAFCPCTSEPRAYAGPKLFSRSIAVRKASALNSGKLRSSTRSSTRRYFTRVASRVDGVRRSRSATSSRVCGLVCPKRNVLSRRTPFRIDVELTRRTRLRSSPQRWRVQRPCSVASLYFASRMSKSTLPSSNTTARACSARKSSSASEICSTVCCGSLVVPREGAVPFIPALPVFFGAQVGDMRDMVARVPGVDEGGKLHRHGAVFGMLKAPLPLLFLERLQQHHPAGVQALHKLQRPLHRSSHIVKHRPCCLVIGLDGRPVFGQRKSNPDE